MPTILPFRAYQYDVEKAGRIDDLVTQPYDKISSEMRSEYLNKSPYNIVRITKNSDYREAAQHLDHWIKTGVLIQDATPSFYPYEQRFEYEGEQLSRLGFIGLLSLKKGSMAVKGHERILQGPLEDRLKLMRSAECNEGLIFMLYSDSSMQVEQLLSDFTGNTQPILKAVDEYRVSHHIWQLSDSEQHTHIQQVLKKKPLYIADGHHRFQTALHYSEECSHKSWEKASTESFDSRTVALFNMESPGLKILPTHRGIRNLKDFISSDFLTRLEAFFEVKNVSNGKELDRAMSGGGIRLGMATQDNNFFLLKLREACLEDSEFMPEASGAARRLDVNVLHEVILTSLLGIGAEQLASQEYVDYFREKYDLLEQLHKKRYQLSFFLNPTSLEQVREISESGNKMPQKSTDFYPKLLTGLIVMKMKIKKRGSF